MNQSDEAQRRVLAALDVSVGAQARGGFEHELSMPADGLTAISEGVFDIHARRVAFRQRFLIRDDDSEQEPFMSHWVETFFDGSNLYICDAAGEVGGEDEWTVVDYAGVQASPLNIAYWLYGIQEAFIVDASSRFLGGAVFQCGVLLSAAIKQAPEGDGAGIRMSIEESELSTDVPVRMLVTIDVDGRLRAVETALPANAVRGAVDLRLELFASPQAVELEPPTSATPQEVGDFIHNLSAPTKTDMADNND